MMKLLEVMKEIRGIPLTDEDGNTEELKLLPPLTSEEIKRLQSRIPCRIPEEVKELLLCNRGFEGVLESIDFSGNLAGIGMEELFPHALPIAHDGYGNYWIVDLTKDSTTWGPIFYVCHDAPVIIYQTDDLAHFIREVIRFGNPPWESEIHDVHDRHQSRIWKENPGLITFDQCMQSQDADLIDFAKSLGEKHYYIDLRKAKVGDGFSWGRYGPKTVSKRYGEKRIFAYESRPSLMERLFGMNR